MVVAWWYADEREHRVSVESPDEAGMLLRALRPDGDELAPMVEFRHGDDGASLIVAAADPTVLTYMQGADPPYFVSAGADEGTESLWFQYGGSESEFNVCAAVPERDAFAALHQFFASEALPGAVGWTEA